MSISLLKSECTATPKKLDKVSLIIKKLRMQITLPIPIHHKMYKYIFVSMAASNSCDFRGLKPSPPVPSHEQMPKAIATRAIARAEA